MTEQQQAELLARWLEEGGPPPPELDMDAADAMIAFRPDLAGPLTLSADDILAGLPEGLFGAPEPVTPAVRENPMPVGASLGASPDEAPSAGASRSRRPWWLAVAGVGGFGGLAAAALALVVVGGTLITQADRGSEPQSAMERSAAPVASAPVREAPLDAVAVADTGAPGPGDRVEGDAVASRRPAGRPVAQPSPRPSPEPYRPEAVSPPRQEVARAADRPAQTTIPEVVTERVAAGPTRPEDKSEAQTEVAFADEDAELEEELSLDQDAGRAPAAAGEARVASVSAEKEVAAKAKKESRTRDDLRKQKDDARGAPMAPREDRAYEDAKSAADEAPLGGVADGALDDQMENTANTAQPAPPAPPVAAAPPASSGPGASPTPTPTVGAPAATSADAHQGAASSDPLSAQLRTLGTTMGWSRALPAIDSALASHPEPTALRQELLALKGDALAATGDLPGARAAWSQAVAVRIARGG